MTSVLFSVCFATAGTAWTQATTEISDANLCAAAAFEAERILKVPAYLMQAIALTESGHWDPADRRRKAWPWAVGAKGQGWYFDTKGKAIAHVDDLKQQGISNIDIGCMQINLRYHGKAFRTTSEGFNPINNVAYAGIFLNELFRIRKSWTEAVKYYHSATPKYNRRYIQLVFKNWEGLRNQAQQNVQQPQFGIEIDAREPLTPKKLIENTNERLPENERNTEIQTLLMQDSAAADMQLQKDILRYDAFARVQAAQQLQRQFALDNDTVPPPLVDKDMLPGLR